MFSASLNIISKYFKKRPSLATGIVSCGKGGGVLVLGPLLQTIKSDHVQNAILKVEARTGSADTDFQIGQSGLVGVV